MTVPPPVFDDKPCACPKCGHVFGSYLYRVVTTTDGEALSLIDRDNDVIYDLVKVCHFCAEVFHWHTKEKTMREHSAIYQMAFKEITAFDKLMSHYQLPLEVKNESAIIDADNSTG